ncbi:60S ribosomal protein-like protein L34 [Halenospora varia]|nr:60S ribosomal protein-like protein L34 [Halenospora varia]
MLCRNCVRGFNVLSKSSIAPRIVQDVVAKRTFTSLTPLRPSIFPSAFRQTSQTTQSALQSSQLAEGVQIDLALAPFKMSMHPAMASMQVRCAPRNTFNPSHFVRKRRHGFLSRLRSRTGRMTLQRRKAKRRSTLSH